MFWSRRTCSASSSSARSPSFCIGFCRIVFLGGPRIAYRYFRYTRTRQHALRRGRQSYLDSWPRRRRRGFVARHRKRRGAERSGRSACCRRPLADQGQSIRGIPVLGDFSDLDRVVSDFAERDTIVSRVVFTPSAFEPDAKPEATLMHARRLGLDGEPPAFARRWRRDAAAGAGQCRGFVAAAERQDRLRAAGRFPQRQIGRGDRRRRLDRCRDLRPRHRVRRVAAAHHREFRTGTACGARNARHQSRRGP